MYSSGHYIVTKLRKTNHLCASSFFTLHRPWCTHTQTANHSRLSNFDGVVFLSFFRGRDGNNGWDLSDLLQTNNLSSSRVYVLGPVHPSVFQATLNSHHALSDSLLPIITQDLEHWFNLVFNWCKIWKKCIYKKISFILCCCCCWCSSVRGRVILLLFTKILHVELRLIMWGSVHFGHLSQSHCGICRRRECKVQLQGLHLTTYIVSPRHTHNHWYGPKKIVIPHKTW